MANNIFTASKGFYGIFGPNNENAVQVKMSRANTGTVDALSDGFLADNYAVQWGRPVQIKRVFNTTQPLAIVGYGTGSLTLSGLLGTASAFTNIVGANSDTNADIANPLTIIIESAGGFSKCENGKLIPIKDNCIITLTNAIVSTLSVTGQIMENGTLYQQATINFQIGGLSVG